jgi:predicted RNase H-like nuclease
MQRAWPERPAAKQHERVTMSQAAPVLGVDGCRGGWVGVVLVPGRPVGAVFGGHIGELVAAASTLPPVAAAGGLAAVGVDMPLHLSDEGHRPCDLAARRHLGRKASSLFVTPPRAALAAESYAAGVVAARAVTGSAFSRQAWALRAKVLELDAWWPSAPAAAPVREVHPEVSFSLMTGAPIMAGKRTWAGAAARRSVLAGEGIELPDDLGPAGLAAGADDVLDAAAVAWTARRIAAGVARPFPDPPVDLGGGRVQAIWA